MDRRMHIVRLASTRVGEKLLDSGTKLHLILIQITTCSCKPRPSITKVPLLLSKGIFPSRGFVTDLALTPSSTDRSAAAPPPQRQFVLKAAKAGKKSGRDCKLDGGNLGSAVVYNCRLWFESELFWFIETSFCYWPLPCRFHPLFTHSLRP